MMMQSAGVGVLAGTDLPPNTRDGSIHDELAAMVKARLSRLQALNTATCHPAAFLGTLASSGTIEQGKFADLVLLDADPVADIRNSAKISAVILRDRSSAGRPAPGL